MIMLGKQIRDLERLKAQYQARLESVHDADADPNIKAVYQSDIMYQIMNIESAIKHEKNMLPFKYLLIIFVGAVLGLIIYSI